MRMCKEQLVFQWCAAAFACRRHPEGDQGLPPATRSGSRRPRQYEDRKRARTRRHRLGLCRRWPQSRALACSRTAPWLYRKIRRCRWRSRPLATGSAQGFRDLDKRRDIKMTIEITGCATSHDDKANVAVHHRPDRPQRMIGRHALLRRYITEHRFLLVVFSAHSFASRLTHETNLSHKSFRKSSFSTSC